MATRSALRATTAIMVSAVVATTALVAPAAAAGTEPPVVVAGHHRTQEAMDATVEQGVPGVLGQVVDRRGTWNGTSGVGDIRTHRPRGADDTFRVGSITKTFVATVVLQLEAEGALDLDDTVEHWLPGVVRGNGHDGRKVTLRQLLNHTSGIAEMFGDPAARARITGKGFLKHRYDDFTPQEAIDAAMRQRPTFEPGTGWSYSNTNYVLAGLVIEKVTGHPYGTEVERRVLRPLGLRDTVVPGTDPRMPDPHGRAYSKLLVENPGPRLYDVTELNPSIAYSAGEMISTAGDLNRFYRALLRGELLPQRQQKELLTTVPVGDEAPGARYGLGLETVKLSCGVQVWGHGGGIHGSSSEAVTTRDGSHAASFNVNADWVGSGLPLVEAEFCPSDSAGR